jgi:hypothetical protein
MHPGVICQANHPIVQLREKLSILVDNPGRGENEQPVISGYYKEATPLSHLIHSGNCLLAFKYTHESLFYETRVPFGEGKQAKDHDKFKTIFHKKMRTSKCFTTDCSKMESEPFVGFALIDIRDGTSWKFR